MIASISTLGPYGRAAFGLAMATLGMVSVIGYVVYLRAIWGNRELQKRTIFLMSLCVSDLLMIFGHMAWTVAATFHQSWPFGDLGCQVTAFFAMGPALVSIANVTLISIDTYYRECKKEYCGVNYGIYLAAIWITGLAAGFLPILGMGSYGFESPLQVGCLLDFHEAKRGIVTYIALLTVVWFIYPMFKLVKYYNMLQKETGDGFLLRVVPTQMLCTWTPYAVCSVLFLVAGLTNVPQVPLAIISNLCAKISIASNPYIYIAGDPKLRIACQQMLFGKKMTFNNDVTIKEKST
ncbi:visual pigment-like receptor peropsin [Styela clava]